MKIELSLFHDMGETKIVLVQIGAKERHIGGGNMFQFTADKLNVALSSFHAAIKKDLRIGRFTPNKEPYWLVPVSSHDELCIVLEANDIQVIHLPHTIQKLIRISDSKTPTSLTELKSYSRLYPYQKEGVDFVINHGGRAIIGDEMGLGKTYQAGVIMNYYNVSSLIVCPASLRVNWQKEYKDISGNTLYIMKDGKSEFQNQCVISYSLLTSKKVKDRIPQFDLLILDESHYIKSQKSQRTKLLTKIAKKCKYILLLSGTPSSKSEELFSQLKIVEHTLFKSFYPWKGRGIKGMFYFGSRYCNPEEVFIGRGRTQFKFNGDERSWELYAILKHFMIRRTKDVVLKDLPPKLRQRLVLDELSDAKTTWFKRELKKVDHIRDNEGARSAEFKLMELVNETSKIKQKFIINYIKHIIFSSEQSDDKILIFAHHHGILDAISELLQEQNQKHICIDGRTTSSRRQNLVDIFQNDKSVKYAVLGVKATGCGLNLYKANIVIFAELLWNQKDMLQAEDRAHRIGQERRVTVKYLILQGSTDDIIWQSINSKVRNSASVLDNKRTYMKASTQNAIEEDPAKSKKQKF